MRKFYALLIVVAVFIPLAIAVMTLVSIHPWVLDRSFYENLLSNEALYQAELTHGLPNIFTRDLFVGEGIAADALNNALREVITADYLRGQSLSAVDTAFDYIDGRRRNIEVSFDVTPIKLALRGDGGSRFAERLAVGLPNCAAGEVPITPGGSLPHCLAAESSTTAAAEQIANALPALIDTMPDSIVASADANLQMGWFRYNTFFTNGIRPVVDMAIIGISLMALLAWVTGAYLGGINLRTRLKWGSSSLFAPASLLVFVGLLLTSTPVLSAIGSSITIRYSEAYRQALVEVLTQVFQQVGVGFVITGAVACLIAFGLLIWSLITPAGDHASVKVVQVPAGSI